MFKYTPHFIPSSIIVVGCGGTGSRLVPMLAQLAKTMLKEFNPLGWKDELPIFLIDGDIVEEKNLVRQNFISQDVGKNKAVVLADRYSRGFGIPIHPISRMVERDLNPITYEVPSYGKQLDLENCILVMAVDSPQARRDILSVFMRNPINIFVVDAGNEDNFGQVKFFTNSILRGSTYSVEETSKERLASVSKFPKMVPEPFSVNYIPYSKKYYINLGTTVAEKSCADLDQTLAINAMMATIMCGIIQNFLYIKPFTYNQINYSLNGAVSTVFNTPQFWFSEDNIEPLNSYSNRSSIPAFKTLSGENKGEFPSYQKHVNLTLNKMGLELDFDTGECKVKAQEPEKAPKKKSKPKSARAESPTLEVQMEQDIDF